MLGTSLPNPHTAETLVTAVRRLQQVFGTPSQRQWRKGFRRDFLAVGADVIEMDTLALHRFRRVWPGRSGVHGLNERKAANWRSALAAEFSSDRFVAGSIGPGKLPTWGMTDTIQSASLQGKQRGLYDGGLTCSLSKLVWDVPQIKQR